MENNGNGKKPKQKRGKSIAWHAKQQRLAMSDRAKLVVYTVNPCGGKEIIWSDKLKNWIYEHMVMKAMSLADCCKQLEISHYAVHKERQKDPFFDSFIEQAIADRSDHWASEGISIAVATPEDEMAIKKSKLVISTAMKTAEKLKPKKWGQKMEHKTIHEVHLLEERLNRAKGLPDPKVIEGELDETTETKVVDGD